MPSKQRYVVVGTIALAVVVGLVLAHGFQAAWNAFNLTDPLPFGIRELPLTALLGYSIALAGAVGVLKHEPTHMLALEIADELGRVSWPSREETGNATLVVIVAVLICSAYLGIFDAFWLWVTDMVLGTPKTAVG